MQRRSTVLDIADATVRRRAPAVDRAAHSIRSVSPRGHAGRRTPEIDGFRDLELIAAGGSSTVYAATERRTGRRVAVKVLSSTSAARDRLSHEARVLRTLADVEGIVSVDGVTVTADGRAAIVLELLSGGSLKDRLVSGALAPSEVISMGTRLAAALGVAHRRGVVHRDLKPANVMFDAAGRPVIADFGIAVTGDRPASTTTSNSMSPPHAPPERFGEDTAVDPRLGDVYSLASTLYTALDGAPPFGTAQQGGIAGLITRVLGEPVPPLRRRDAPPGLDAVLRRAMAKQPGRRHRSMELLVADLRSVVGGVTDPNRSLGRR